MKRPLEMAHDFLAEVVTQDDIVVDATMGNGHDTLFLAKLAKQVYAFDIQEQALEKTQERLDQASLKGGRIAIMIYYGHEGGDIEKDAVLDFVSQLNQQEYTATIYRTLNQVNNPPFLVMIEKLERYRHG